MQNGAYKASPRPLHPNNVVCLNNSKVQIYTNYPQNAEQQPTSTPLRIDTNIAREKNVSFENSETMVKSSCFGRRKGGLTATTRQILVDVFIWSLLSIPVLLFFLVIEPSKIGFFCDDQSLRYPHKSDTISTPILLAVSLITPLFVLFGTEMLNRCQSHISFTQEENKMLYALKGYSMFLFGVIINQIFVEIGKSCLGRLRPNFVAVCQPDFTKINCSQGYITDYVCTNMVPSWLAMRDSHLSFPSGHAAFSTYCMLYTVFYLQYRFNVQFSRTLKPTLQVLLLVFAFYCSASRITDYKHHMSDIYAGGVLGVVTAVLIFSKLTTPLLAVEPPRHTRTPYNHSDSVMTTVSDYSDDSPAAAQTTPIPLLSKEQVL